MYTKEDLAALDTELRQMADETYRNFHGKLIPGVDTVFYGVRVPALRRMAKKIARDKDWRGFLELAGDSGIYEMNMLCGMVIAAAKCEFEEKLCDVEKFIPHIDNWAVCDTFCADFKEVRENLPRMYRFLEPYLKSDREYEVRFAAVILMQYFLTEEYIAQVLQIYDTIRHEGYYVKMAVAWGISASYVKFRKETLAYLGTCHLDDFTYNKSIQKMLESLQVSAADKEMLRKMKRK